MNSFYENIIIPYNKQCDFLYIYNLLQYLEHEVEFQNLNNKQSKLKQHLLEDLFNESTKYENIMSIFSVYSSCFNEQYSQIIKDIFEMEEDNETLNKYNF